MKSSAFKSLFASCVIVWSLVGIVSMASAQGTIDLTPTSSTPTTGAPTQSISGDEICGSSQATICKPSDLKRIMRSALLFFATIGSVGVFIFIMARIVLEVKAYMIDGDPGALKKAKTDTFNALVGFIIVLVVMGGGYILLVKAFGTQPWVIGLLQFFAYGLVDHAYAAEQLLPNPYGSNSFYDIIITAANLVMRFFIYPALVAMWVASGFKLVYSQGNPEGLKTARNWFLVAVIVTVIAFSLQGLIVAFKGTAEKILPAAQTETTGTTDGRGQRLPGTYGAACTEGGYNGIIGTDGKCQIGGSRQNYS